MHRNQLLNLLKSYRTRFMEEVAYVRRAIDLIKQDANVVSPDREQVLLMHHRKYGHWFQPGGHADGDPDVLRVALRECAEETGVDPAHIRLIDPAIFDVDIHSVPSAATVPGHDHIDIRFVVEIDDRLDIPGNNESHEVKWFSLYEVMHYNKFRSTYRMLEKTRAMRNPVNVLRQQSA
jgi:8-oxo-dGTP pyrophosphatase MutT (NUDIX family)